MIYFYLSELQFREMDVLSVLHSAPDLTQETRSVSPVVCGLFTDPFHRAFLTIGICVKLPQFRWTESLSFSRIPSVTCGACFQ